MKSLVAALLLAIIADGIRLKWKQDNKSVSLVEHLVRDEKLLEAKKVERLTQHGKSVGFAGHVEGDWKLLKANEVEKPNGKLSTYTSLQQARSPPPTSDSRPLSLGTLRAAEIALVSTLILMCCAWCLCANPDPAARRSRDRRKETYWSPLYVTYWDVDGKDPTRPWNPTEQGGTDGVQLAVVKDGEVKRIPTDGICTQHSSDMHKSKEWHQLNIKSIRVVNYSFDAIPTASTVYQYKEQFGVEELELRETIRGKITLAVGEIFEAFHKAPRGSND